VANVPGSYAVQVAAASACGVYEDVVEVHVVCGGGVTAAVTTVPHDATALTWQWGATGGSFPSVALNASGSSLAPPAGTSAWSSAAAAAGVLTHTWSVVAAPPRSAARLTKSGAALAAFTPDVPGMYVLEVAAAQPGCGSGGVANVTVAAVCNTSLVAAPPPALAVVSGSRNDVTGAPFPAVTLTPGATVVPSWGAGGWVVARAPAGSRAALAAAPAGTPAHLVRYTATFTPDVPGVYAFDLHVTDGCGEAVGTTVLTASCATAYLPSPPPGGVVLMPMGTPLAFPARVGALAPPPVYLPGAVMEAATGRVWSAANLTAPLRVAWTGINHTDVAVAANGGFPVGLDGAVANAGDMAQPCEDDPTTLVNERIFCATSATYATLYNASSLSHAYFVPDVLGIYAFTLAVTDNCTTWMADVAVSVVCNAPPHASAGADAVARRGRHNAFVPVALDATGSTDADAGDVLAYAWELVSAPAGSSVTAALAPAAALTSFLPDVNGEYVWSVSVSDGCSTTSATTRVWVTCNAPPVAAVRGGESGPLPLVYDAGSASFGALLLDGSFSWDPDGADDIATYTWRFIAVHSAATNATVVPSPAEAAAALHTLPALAGDATSPAIIVFTPPASIFTVDADLHGGALESEYVLALTVSDGCASSSVNVTATASCGSPPAVVVHSPPVAVTWNARTGSRYAYPPPATPAASYNVSEAVVCADPAAGSCGTHLTLNATSVYGHVGETYAWTWATAPPASPYYPPAGATVGIAAPTSLNTSATLAQLAFNGSKPFAAGSLGGSLAGAYRPTLRVTQQCVSMAAAANVTLACNSPPTAAVSTPQTVVYSQASLWGSVSLSGSGSPASAGGDAGEAARDSLTTRIGWSINFTSSAVPGANVAGGVGGPGAAGPRPPGGPPLQVRGGPAGRRQRAGGAGGGAERQLCCRRGRRRRHLRLPCRRRAPAVPHRLHRASVCAAQRDGGHGGGGAPAAGCAAVQHGRLQGRVHHGGRHWARQQGGVRVGVRH